MTSTSWRLDRTERGSLARTVHHAMRAQLGPLTIGFDFGAGTTIADCTETDRVVIALLELEPARLVGCIQLDSLPDWIDTETIVITRQRDGYSRCRWQATQATACGTFTLERTNGDLWLVHAHAQLYRPHHHY